MSSSNFSLERTINIWNDKTGERIEIGPDRDGLDLCSIRYVHPSGEVGSQINFSREEINLVAQAINELWGAIADEQ